MPYTRFEKARILGARALQISLGASSLLTASPGVMDALEIAKREFESGTIPLATPGRAYGDR